MVREVLTFDRIITPNNIKDAYHFRPPPWGAVVVVDAIDDVNDDVIIYA